MPKGKFSSIPKKPGPKHANLYKAAYKWARIIATNKHIKASTKTKDPKFFTNKQLMNSLSLKERESAFAKAEAELRYRKKAKKYLSESQYRRISEKIDKFNEELATGEYAYRESVSYLSWKMVVKDPELMTIDSTIPRIGEDLDKAIEGEIKARKEALKGSGRYYESYKATSKDVLQRIMYVKGASTDQVKQAMENIDNGIVNPNYASIFRRYHEGTLDLHDLLEELHIEM